MDWYLPAKKAMVCGEQLCFLTIRGGLNFVNLESWNKVVISKYFWAIALKYDKLWIKRVHSCYIKQVILWIMSVLKKIASFIEIFDQGNIIQDFTLGEIFSIKKCYYALNGYVAPVSWRGVVCNNEASPKSIFITWLAILNIITTKARLASWNLIADVSCHLCQ